MSLSRWLGLRTPKRPSESSIQVKEEEKKQKVKDENLADILSKENARLRDELQKLALQLHEKSSDEGQPSSEGANDIYKQLDEDANDISTNAAIDSPVDLTAFSKKYKPLSPTTSPTSPSSTTDVETDSRKAVLVCLPSKDEMEEDQVCMVDLSEAEWWTIVDSARDREAMRDEADTYVECELASESKNDDDDSYLLVEEKQLGDALTSYVAQTILKKYPEAKTLTEKQLNQLIDSSFNGLKEPTTIGRYIKYGHMAYTTYGWGMCVWNLYKDPAMAKLVAKGAIRAAKWMLILVW